MKAKITEDQMMDSKKLITIIQSVPANKREQFEASLNGYLDGYTAGFAAACNMENSSEEPVKKDA